MDIPEDVSKEDCADGAEARRTNRHGGDGLFIRGGFQLFGITNHDDLV
jgi:hypothetical protein